MKNLFAYIVAALGVLASTNVFAADGCGASNVVAYESGHYVEAYVEASNCADDDWVWGLKLRAAGAKAVELPIVSQGWIVAPIPRYKDRGETVRVRAYYWKAIQGTRIDYWKRIFSERVYIRGG